MHMMTSSNKGSLLPGRRAVIFLCHFGTLLENVVKCCCLTLSWYVMTFIFKIHLIFRKMEIESEQINKSWASEKTSKIVFLKSECEHYTELNKWYRNEQPRIVEIHSNIETEWNKVKLTEIYYLAPFMNIKNAGAQNNNTHFTRTHTKIHNKNSTLFLEEIRK